MFGYAYWNTRNAVQNSYVPVAHTHIRNAELSIEHKKPISILLGTDTGTSGRHYRGRTDTIMLATLYPRA